MRFSVGHVPFPGCHFTVDLDYTKERSAQQSSLPLLENRLVAVRLTFNRGE